MRTAPVALAVAAALVAAAVPAHAAGARKPRVVVRTYTANAPVPDPTEPLWRQPCPQITPDSWDEQEVRVTGRATLDVTVYGFTGDWDVAIVDSKDAQLAWSSNSVNTQNDAQTERTSFRITKSGLYRILACNYAGGPTASVRYVLTYA